jgi:uncharacterized membrane protein YhhN
MIPGFILFFLVAVIDWAAVAKNWKKVEYIAKPAAMLILLGMLALVGNFGSLPLICFGLGIFFSLVGDVFLMVSYARFSERWFLPGLAAFLFAHLSYIVGLNTPLPNISPIWSLGMAFVLALAAGRILRLITDGVRKKGLPRMVRPVNLYGMVITLMLLSALLTLSNTNWKISAGGLVTVGAILFILQTSCWPGTSLSIRSRTAAWQT